MSKAPLDRSLYEKHPEQACDLSVLRDMKAYPWTTITAEK